LASLAKGDTNAYRQACGEMFARFGRSSNYMEIVVYARLAVLFPGGGDITGLVQSAEQVAEAHPERPDFSILYCLVLYRNGQLKEAIQRLEERLSTASKDTRSSPELQIRAYSILAAAHARLGHGTQAARYWKEAKPLIQDLSGDRNRAYARLGWEEREEVAIFSREAEQLVDQATELNQK